jgi:FtsP/CotA-like multicopper oxidase with cupredoxin domain
MKKGPSFTNVPDMIGAGAGQAANTANDGTGTLYFTNQQSSRLLFFHDHAWGTTRLNVYKGVAAPYLIVGQVEDDLIDGTNTSGGNPAATQILPNLSYLSPAYRYGIPLVIQDRSFVNDTSTDALRSSTFPLMQYDPTSHTYESTCTGTTGGTNGTGYKTVTDTSCGTDPLWQIYVGSKGGQLWLGHEYMPVENIYDPTGNTTNGRWDYGPFMIPPMIPTNLVLPSPTTIPEAFGDTMLVNGTAFPYVVLPPDVVRFRILGVGNDRVLNLQLYKSDPLTIRLTNRGSGYTAAPVVTITNAVGDATSTYTSATATVSTGVITDISPSSTCKDFTSPPTVTLSGGGGTCTYVAAIIAANSNGVITGFQFDGCTGFTTAPTVTVTGGGGRACNATATVIPPGQILNVTVTGATGYQATPTVTIAPPTSGTQATALAYNNTEVRMVDAAPNPTYPTWPVDGRDGGVPDPTTQGPPWILIGNESGILAQASVIPPQPIDFEYNRQNIPFAGVTSHSLLLFPAQRADVLVDFRGYPDGTTFILYNDAPAPLPLPWPINDYYTDDPDQRLNGGPPTTPPGFGPNIRTVMQIRIQTPNGFAPFASFSAAAVKTAIPQAFAVEQNKPIVPQVAYNDAYPGFAASDIYVQAPDSTLNLTGTGQSIARIKTTAPGNNYTVAPKVTIIGDGINGAATAGLNPCGGVTLLTAGSGYTTTPTCTIGAPGAGGVRATCVATISGGIVNAIQIDEPGSNYSTATAATCTIGAAPAGGVTATCSTFVAVANTVGSITVTNAGSGYTTEPRVYITPNNAGGMGATAVALLNGAAIMTTKNITEGFDPDYGRMDIRMGSTPNPLTPTVGAGMVMGLARYIDPPTEIVNDGENTLWRITHLGVDSHALHFHLFDVQVVNRVDFTNVVKPPYPDELGWRDTIRTNPMEDIVVAFRPTSMVLPFVVPSSNRLLDPTTPVNSVTNFLPIAPPAGVAAVPQVTNIMTNFGWEYVFHCHMLGHEENDFMRPVVFTGAVPPAPSGLAAVVTAPTANTVNVALTWVGSFPSATGFTIQRATNTGFTSNLQTFKLMGTPPPNAYADTTATPSSRYYYRTQSSNTWGTSAWSNVVTVITVVPPSGLTGTAARAGLFDSVTLTWTNNTTTGTTGVAIQHVTNAAFTTGLVTTNVNTPNLTTRTITSLARHRTFYFRVATRTALGNSAWSNVFSITTP